MIEVDTSFGLDRLTTPKPSRIGVLSSHNGGTTFALTVAYRTPYFVSPFLDLGYFPLYAVESDVDLGSAGGRAHAVGSTFALGAVLGLGFDVWRVRLRAGIGGYDLVVHESVLGQTARAAELDLGYAFTVGGFVLERDRFRVGFEGRLITIVDASMTAVSLGITVGFDPLRF